MEALLTRIITAPDTVAGLFVSPTTNRPAPRIATFDSTVLGPVPVRSANISPVSDGSMTVNVTPGWTKVV